QLILGTERLTRSTMSWIGRTGRAQLLWGLAAVITIEIVLIQPWFLLPAVPLFLLGYLDIRARFVAERRARLLATLVEVSHAVGASLDPNEVFRNVYRQVAAVMDADNFFVATLSPDGATVRYRFLVDGGKELEPVERPTEGTLVGATVERGPLLLKEVERDARRLGLPDLESWGAVVEQSIIVAPLRQRDTFVGAISAQSRRVTAYDEGDLQLLAAIANEAAIALERATLHNRTATLSRRRCGRIHAQAPRAVRPRRAPHPPAAFGRSDHRSPLRHLARRARVHRRGARAHRHPRGRRSVDDEVDPSLSRARRGLPLDGLHPHVHDRRARPLPRGPS